MNARLVPGCLVLLALWSCASSRQATSSSSSTVTTSGASSATSSDAPQDAPRFKDGAPLCLVLARGQLVEPVDGACPSGFHVRGTWTRGRFMPAGDVQGEGALGDRAHGMAGWMEIMGGGGAFVPAPTARPPFCPCVDGVQLEDGTFVPTHREVRAP